ncbi:MAG: pilus assembly PilX N-terminal domain-containing protein [Candidatus Gottesmanbacteria bacterium]|nr:pilus assembly PilX N-terminal domain-containing protein [Candidatus Gottesmanbacteria bacterium]
MRQTGQIALIALLVLTIATTVGLSLIARTTTDVSVTRNIEESTRAFSAAEAGIEETLKSGIASDFTIDPALSVKYSTTIVPAGGGVGSPFVFPQKTLKENTETVWLVDHDAITGKIIETPTYIKNTIDVCWSSETTTPALIVSVLYKTSGGAYQVAKAAYDPDGSRANNFSPPTASSGGCTGTNTTYRSRIRFFDLSITPAVDTLIALRIRPVYTGTLIAIAPAPAQALPIQGNQIQSVGTAGSDVNRKIIVYQQYRTPDSIFDYAVYSQGSFSQ